jgi:L-alanine-DL-glutamate epimerase-like enolase superfamily enzyme
LIEWLDPSERPIETAKAYAKPAFGGPGAVLRYLGRYTHRVAISNHRVIAFDGERITFQWTDYARDGQRSDDDPHRHGVSPALSAARVAAPDLAARSCGA